MSPTAPRALSAINEIAAEAAVTSREREKVFFIMVCVFGVSNVPSTGRSSTFEYRKRKKPKATVLVARQRGSEHPGKFRQIRWQMKSGATSSSTDVGRVSV